jgi:hypothetical protein
MAVDDDEFERRIRREAGEQRQTDFDDLQNEMAGRETGRMPRFLSEEVRDARDPRRRADAQARETSRLRMLLMSDPAYAALYKDTFEKLRQAEDAAEQALMQAAAAGQEADRHLEDMLERAQRLEDGTRVFRDHEGRVWSERGGRMDDVTLDALEWRGNEPSYEEYIAGKDAAHRARTETDALQTYQVDVLGHMRNRMTDEDNPVTKEEMEQFQREMDERLPQAAYANGAENSPNTPNVPQSSASIIIPKL